MMLQTTIFETDEQNRLPSQGHFQRAPAKPDYTDGPFCMDNRGIPITYELFPGNTNDCLTYRPNFGRIKKQFDLGRVISVADKGMTTGDNIWYTINTPTHDGYDFQQCPSEELKKGSKTMSSKKRATSGLARNINENPENPQERSWLLLSPAKR